MSFLGELGRDLVYAFRTLLSSPGFAAVGVISLGLGIGVNTAAFSEINALLFRDLPCAHDPSRLVTTERAASYPYFEHYRDRRDLFACVAAYIAAVPFNVALEGPVNAKS